MAVSAAASCRVLSNLGGMTGTTYRVRKQPCAHCGRAVVIVETVETALGGLWRLAPITRVEHADFERSWGESDRVDGKCRRPPQRSAKVC